MERDTPHAAIALRGLLTRRAERREAPYHTSRRQQVTSEEACKRGEELIVGADEEEAWELSVYQLLQRKSRRDPSFDASASSTTARVQQQE